MDDYIVRLEGVTIQNFKNVVKGELSLFNNRKNFKSSILGLYGQNGSGKTALIDAIELLQLALRGMSIPIKFADCINVESEYAEFSYAFSICGKHEKYKAIYAFKIMGEKSGVEQNTTIKSGGETQYKTIITDEILSYSYDNNHTKIRMSNLIDTNSKKVFSPAIKYGCLIGNNKEINMSLMVDKKVALRESRSFIFSRELLTAIRNNTPSASDLDYFRHVNLIESLVGYGNFELFVINTSNSGIISMNMLPISFRYEDGCHNAIGNILVPLEESVPIPESALLTVENVIKNMNVVLSQIIPGLTISIENLGDMITPDGKKGVKVQLMSLKNKKAIPLKYESEGIKKIISILQLLIVVYNRSSITVAVDELDAGIFEYLLGEVLRIISEKGKGQLLFTSHNLRPLETIDRGFIAFTTTNPYNRYMRIVNVKDNNNLRDTYFRNIILGEQSEDVYELTNNFEIALAFRKAGECCGS